jgi:putative endonuclease
MVYSVYLLANRSKTLYTGVTNNLVRRVWQLKKKEISGFTRSCNIDCLVYYESFGEVRSAIQREKQIKGWLRAKKIALIESMNPRWLDLTPTLTCHPERSEGPRLR